MFSPDFSDNSLGQLPCLGCGAVALVEPHGVALGGLAVSVVEGQAGLGRHGVAPLALGDSPQLRGRAVRVGQHGGAAGLGEQHAARRDPVQARGGVALEVEGDGRGR